MMVTGRLRIKSFVTALVLLMMTLPALAQNTPQRGGQIIMVLENDPRPLNPAIYAGGTADDVMWQVYDSLVELGADLTPRPLLAKSWKISPDGLSYTFQLKENVTWHDGRPLTAEDVAFTFYSHLHPRTNSIMRSVLSPLAGYDELTNINSPADPKSLSKPPIEVLDPLTVRFNLRYPYGPFLMVFINPQGAIAPKHLLEGTDINTAPLGQRPVGTGPFRFVEWRRGDQIVLEANDKYHRGRPYLDRVIFKIMPEMTTRISQLRSRQIDFVRSPAADAISELQKNPRLQTLAGNDVNYRALLFNLGKPIFQDVKLRQAVCYAIDKATITRTLGKGYQTIATGIIPPQSWAYNPNVNKYAYDVNRARTLLREAGWAPGADGVLVKGAERLSFGLNVEIYENLPDVAVAIQGQLKQVGIDVTPQPLEYSTLLDRWRQRNFELSIIATGGSPDPDIVSSQTFRTGGGRNWSGYSNPAVDEILESARRVRAVAVRKQFYARFQQIMADDAPYCYMYHQQRWYAFGKEFKGFEYLGVSVGVLQSLRKAWIQR